jgi:hypothetical protein
MYVARVAHDVDDNLVAVPRLKGSGVCPWALIPEGAQPRIPLRALPRPAPIGVRRFKSASTCEK